ncbi:MAG: sulfurtransferase-like selenium metabolism protein YedF [Pseudomonadota bacterium]
MTQHEIFTLDARGLLCPEPVIQTKKIFDEGKLTHFTVIVDNEAAKENVCRFARNRGATVESVQTEANCFTITIVWENPNANYVEKEELIPCPLPGSANILSKNVVYIGSNTMGRGDEGLGAQLMRGFLRTIIDSAPLPWRLIFINSGVKLTSVDIEAVEALHVLEDKGVEILSCGTCLEKFGLVNQIQAGRITNMFEVVETLNTSAKVIAPC